VSDHILGSRTCGLVGIGGRKQRDTRRQSTSYDGFLAKKLRGMHTRKVLCGASPVLFLLRFQRFFLDEVCPGSGES
jgi:hypothetical protein